MVRLPECFFWFVTLPVPDTTPRFEAAKCPSRLSRSLASICLSPLKSPGHVLADELEPGARRTQNARC